MEIELWLVDRPTPYKKNARKLSDRAVEVVASSIRQFGWRQPIVVDDEGVIIVGHTRLLAAKALGMTEVPVHVARGLSPAQVQQYRLMDNRSADESSWDTEVLEQEMADLQALEADLGLTGFSEAELEEILRPPLQQDEDAAPDPPPAAVSKLGDLWLLDAHRVLCADATDSSATLRLLGGKLADLAFTDPPYNVNYEGYTEQHLKLQGDHLSRDDFAAFLAATFACYARAVKPAGSLYVCHPSSSQREFQDALEAAGFEVRTQIIWAKNTFAWGFGRYKFQHEPIFYCHHAGKSDRWFGDKTQSTLWQVNKPGASRLHPTMKPVELIERALENSSVARNTVLDLFGGSGSTLIACEKTGRRARLMELDPRYVDVILMRWQSQTGKLATLEGTDGRTFEDMKAERLAEGLAA